MIINRGSAALIVVLLAGTAGAVEPRKLKADAPDEVKAFWQACIAAKPVAIKRFEAGIKYWEAALATASKIDRKEEIALCEVRLAFYRRELAAATDPGAIVYAPMAAPTSGAIGAIGDLGIAPWIFIIQVRDKRSAEVHITVPKYVEKGAPKMEDWPRLILRGIDCSAWVNAAEMPQVGAPQAWKVVEVLQAEPGKPPLPILEPFDFEPYFEPVAATK
jgi:hypothetical protein